MPVSQVCVWRSNFTGKSGLASLQLPLQDTGRAVSVCNDTDTLFDRLSVRAWARHDCASNDDQEDSIAGIGPNPASLPRHYAGCALKSFHRINQSAA